MRYRKYRDPGIVFLLLIFLVIAVVVGNAEVRVLFAPEQGEEMVETLMSAIREAKSRVYVLIYSFTLDELAAALIESHQSGTEVRVIMDQGQAESKRSVDETLMNAGIPVKKLTGSSGGYMHIKMIITDDVVMTGSYNWSRNATERNDENLLVMRNEEEILGAHLAKFEMLWNDRRN